MLNSRFLRNTLIALSVLTTSTAVYAPLSLSETPVSVDQSITVPYLSGTFEGRSDHITKGTVTIVQTDTGYTLTLSDDFYLDGAPDPVIGFGKAGKYIKASQVEDLKSKRGGQTYQLPKGFNPAQFDEVYVWCEKFSLPLGVAKIS